MVLKIGNGDVSMLFSCQGKRNSNSFHGEDLDADELLPRWHDGILVLVALAAEMCATGRR
jgi:hypothetical protein